MPWLACACDISGIRLRQQRRALAAWLPRPAPPHPHPTPNCNRAWKGRGSGTIHRTGWSSPSSQPCPALPGQLSAAQNRTTAHGRMGRGWSQGGARGKGGGAGDVTNHSYSPVWGLPHHAGPKSVATSSSELLSFWPQAPPAPRRPEPTSVRRSGWVGVGLDG